MYLWQMTNNRPRQWLCWLPWAEYIYNTSFHTAVKETPSKLVYGGDTPPASLHSYEAANVHVATVAPEALAERTEFLEDVRFQLEQAQVKTKKMYDQGHHVLSFQAHI